MADTRRSGAPPSDRGPTRRLPAGHMAVPTPGSLEREAIPPPRPRRKSGDSERGRRRACILIYRASEAPRGQPDPHRSACSPHSSGTNDASALHEFCTNSAQILHETRTNCIINRATDGHSRPARLRPPIRTINIQSVDRNSPHRSAESAGALEKFPRTRTISVDSLLRDLAACSPGRMSSNASDCRDDSP